MIDKSKDSILFLIANYLEVILIQLLYFSTETPDVSWAHLSLGFFTKLIFFTQGVNLKVFQWKIYKVFTCVNAFSNFQIFECGFQEI